jgi:hypothetical protein
MAAARSDSFIRLALYVSRIGFAKRAAYQFKLAGVFCTMYANAPIRKKFGL